MSPNVALLKTEDGDIPLTIRISARARHIGLRVDPRIGGAELVLPKGVSTRQGLSFAKSKSDWLLDHLAAMPEPVPFVDGAEIPMQGERLRIHHIMTQCELFGPEQPREKRGPVWLEEGILYVSGDAPHVPRRVRDWLKARARREMTERAMRAAEKLDVVVKGITLRDTRSRWGSCSSAGTLSFSWRLILAPENVLEYVVVHEVAHRAEMNHSPDFWALVKELIDDIDTPKDWLRLHGTSLHRYGDGQA